MLLYDVFYYNARTGVRLAAFDSDRGAIQRAPKGEIAHAVCKNWSSEESYWVDEFGNEPPKDSPVFGRRNRHR